VTTYPDGIGPGKDLGARELVVTGDWIEKYMASIDDRNPWYTEESPMGGPVAPSAVFNYEMQLFGGWHPPGVKDVLNTSQQWAFYRPMRPGQRVTVRARVAGRYVKRGREHIAMEATACDEAGNALCRVTAADAWPVPEGAQPPPSPASPHPPSSVITHPRPVTARRADAIGSTKQPPALARPGPREAGEMAASAISYAAQAPVGSEPAPFSRLVTRQMCAVHGGPLVNFHTDLEAARRLGLHDLMAAGPMFVCFLSEMLTRCFGERWMTGGTLDLKLLKPVFAGETVTARAVVTAHEPAGAAV